MTWVILLIAGLLEVLGVVILNEISRTKKKWLVALLAVAFICSFSTLKVAMNDIPMGTAYAIWSGIGTGGGTLVGMIVYKESKNAKRMFFITLIILSIVGLRLVS
ncbi:QacE family quaternary ammonium compound efflux SMR transporter [Staphylococcus succinus]|jgi:paired small multidrug resistance pump|uniref:QacE family quaternary ammonium compound efflux SMR transporter n=1 Tax=Staphylococcus succinus TaxID=61015 RepID=A0A9Q6MVB0_9STAP|nr:MULTISPECIES: multidrug efflux SMR transporter [Staphylococcus]MBU0438200.1 multidrug efflux SMR transporter [Staphylococcus succinus]MDH9160321.1 multidrug efflux SMR transporter [Staphylococcus succinus]MEB7462443.1 multidrug efflux SMR transporter [Staphylococcus succinus]MEB8123294.1 multidrug efflux SMR transporter [Staphylococcus succinus]MEB8127065.1 multidrug efflux SMR transporter [Staphylococcus succinus]